MTTKVFGLTMSLGLLAFAASSPARGQFMSNYPVIIVPPPAQNLVLPPKPKPAQRATQPAPAAPPSDAPAQAQGPCRFQGQTRVCN
jgi:hypothetical protein